VECGQKAGTSVWIGSGVHSRSSGQLSLQSTRSSRPTWAKVRDDEVSEYIDLGPVGVEMNLLSAAKVLFSSAISWAQYASYDDVWRSLPCFLI
jgi:hypothetical protein